MTFHINVYSIIMFILHSLIIHSHLIIIFIRVQQRLKSPFVLETGLDDIQVTDQSRTRISKRLSGRIVVFRLDSEHKVGKQRMFDLVGGKEDLFVFQ